jgi:hypothetical protein
MEIERRTERESKEGDVSEMESKVHQLQQIFPNFSLLDIISALDSTHGNLEEAVAILCVNDFSFLTFHLIFFFLRS